MRVRTIDPILVAVLLAVGTAALWPSAPLGTLVREWWSERNALASFRGEWQAEAQSRESRWGQPGGTESTAAVFMFTDYECPFCRAADPEVQEWIAGGGVSVTVVHFPLEGHEFARSGAAAAICAEEQGAFARMHQYLIAEEDWMQARPAWPAIVRRTHIHDEGRFLKCLTEASTTSRIRRDLALAERWGVYATPTFISRHVRVAGLGSEEERSKLLGR